MASKSDLIKVPQTLMDQVIDRYPQYLEIYRKEAANRRPHMPAWCPVGIGLAVDYLMVFAKPSASMAGEPAVMTAIAGWMQHKIIYDLDVTLWDELQGNIEVPSEILYQMPYTAPYVALPAGVFHQYDGFFFHLEYDAQRDLKELRILLCSPDGQYPVFLPFEDGKSLSADYLLKTLRDTGNPLTPEADMQKQAAKAIYGIINPLLPVIIYILSEGADIVERPTPPQTRRRGGAREARIMDTGYRIGQQVRQYRYGSSQADSNPQGGAVAPHVRRGHWHSYWTGPRKDPTRRKLIVRWVMPTFVGGDPAGDEPTVREIK